MTNQLSRKTKPTASSSAAELSVFVRIRPFLASEQEEAYLEEMISAAIATLQEQTPRSSSVA
jgi:hypothetical protein